MYKRFPFLKRFWVYFSAIFVLSFMLIGNVYRTDSWTGDKPFSEFTQNDLKLLSIFLFEEIIIAVLMAMFLVLVIRISKKRNIQIIQIRIADKYSGINPADYDSIWFDLDMTERALILKQGDVYKLYVHEYDERTGEWNSVGSVGIYDDLNKLKKDLFFEFDFYCEENSDIDKYGEEEFKD